MIVIKTTLVKILSNFEFALDRSKTQVPLEYSNALLLTPKNGIYLNFKKI
jgi:hypothetical protein